MPGAGCCGHDLEQVDRPTFLAWPPQSVHRRDMNKDIMVLCPSCYLTLKGVNDCLKGNKEEREQTNEMLSTIETTFQGSVNVVHYVDYLLRDDVFSLLKKTFTRLWKGFVSPYTMGVIFAPATVLGFDDPVVPSKIDRLVEATAQAVSTTSTKPCAAAWRFWGPT
jgi:heterodisulfide reductase subunit B